jgi:3'-5' exoribonuclease
MPRINEFTEGDPVEDFFALRSANLREARNGSQYVRVVLGDASGAITGNIWRVTEPEEYHDVADQFRDLARSEVVKVRGTIETYNNALQLAIERIRPAQPEEAEMALPSLVAESPLNRDELFDEIVRLVQSIEDEDYRTLAHLFLDDAAFCEAFRNATAARTFHHAYLGGLLEHTLSIMQTCDEYAQRHRTLRRGLLLVGALLHDVGKLEELSTGVAFDYTDEGMLLGHLTQGVLMLEERLRNLPDFPRVKRNLVMHLILSHHGRREYGSPVLPAIPEAFALHHIDNLDAKVFAAGKAIDEDQNEHSAWTERSFMLESKIYKG